ncbi:hypothetical protein [Enterococcus villorum]|nr:hypothetical protein [Enterococcus villorum]EOH85837.1 hypothetical protein UAO_02731 [Enterococcus villorum ATCC 700913]EOW78584.1 hypothetical protein I591_00124 [Enterococcus villorum ATCC 700913]
MKFSLIGSLLMILSFGGWFYQKRKGGKMTK